MAWMDLCKRERASSAGLGDLCVKRHGGFDADRLYYLGLVFCNQSILSGESLETAWDIEPKEPEDFLAIESQVGWRTCFGKESSKQFTFLRED